MNPSYCETNFKTVWQPTLMALYDICCTFCFLLTTGPSLFMMYLEVSSGPICFLRQMFPSTTKHSTVSLSHITSTFLQHGPSKPPCVTVTFYHEKQPSLRQMPFVCHWSNIYALKFYHQLFPFSKKTPF